MAATAPLVITGSLDTSDLVTQLRGIAKACTDAADALEQLNGHTFEADPIAGAVTPDADWQPLREAVARMDAEDGA